MRLFTIISASALAVLLAASPVRAQDRWTAEVRGGANVNSSQLSTVDLNTGIGFGGALGVRVLPDLFAYGGWDWQHHSAQAPVFGASAHIEDTGLPSACDTWCPSRIERSRGSGQEDSTTMLRSKAPPRACSLRTPSTRWN